MISNYLKVLYLSVTIYKIVVGKREGRVLIDPDPAITQFPYTVFVYTAGYRMSGSVLTQKIILGSHSRANTKPAYIIAGINRIKKESDGIRRNVSHVIKHKCVRVHDIRNSIALYILEETLPLGSTVQQVIISKKYPVPAVMADATAFEKNGGFGLKIDYLMVHKRLRVMSQKNCCIFGQNQGLTSQGYYICAGNRSKKYQQIEWQNRHEGGPLVAYGYHQIGIAVWRPWTRANVSLPQVTLFLNVSYFYNWIVSKARQYGCVNTTGII